MSDKKGKMDQAAKARIMSSEYKKNGGKATKWSKRAQERADKNYPQHYPRDQPDNDSGETGGGWWYRTLWKIDKSTLLYLYFTLYKHFVVVFWIKIKF